MLLHWEKITLYYKVFCKGFQALLLKKKQTGRVFKLFSCHTSVWSLASMNLNNPTFGFLIHHGLPPLNGFQRAPLYSQARNWGGEMQTSWLPSYMWESQKIYQLRILEQGQLSLFHLTEKKKWNGIFTFYLVLDPMTFVSFFNRKITLEWCKSCYHTRWNCKV